ncbi:MAG TPA: hypothetical protein VGD07_15690 [Methylomirabilota bacterium]
MIARLGASFVHAIDVQHVALALAVWVLLTLGSLAIVLRVVLTLPADYFERAAPSRGRWTAGRIARNLAGILIIAVGIVLSVPGVPGQGLLTVLVGVLLVDFPRRQRLERTLVSRRGVLITVNRLRVRFGRPPLRPPCP